MTRWTSPAGSARGCVRPAATQGSLCEGRGRPPPIPHAHRECGGFGWWWRAAARRRTMPHSTRLPIFVLCVATSVTLCTDPAAGEVVAWPVRSIRDPASTARFRPPGRGGNLGDACAERSGDGPPGRRGMVSPGFLLRGLRGGAPSWPEDGPLAWRDHPSQIPYGERMAPRSSWAPAAPYYGGGRAIPYDTLSLDQPSARNGESSGHPSSWLSELFSAEPAVAQVAGDLAVGGHARRPLSFDSHSAFSSAAKTVAFLVGSAARNPREASWRRVRRRSGRRFSLL
jgi:hypothetical protein